MTTDTYKPKLIARVLKAHSERHHRGFFCADDPVKYVQVRAVRGFLEVSPDMGKTWRRLRESEARFTDHLGQPLDVTNKYNNTQQIVDSLIKAF